MLTVGDKFPEYSLKATVGTDLKNAFTDISDKSYEGKWKVYFFWPKETSRRFGGPSVPDARRREAGIDPAVRRAGSERSRGAARDVRRSPDNIIRFAYVTDLSVGRNPQEVLRVLDASQADELCPCNWKKGEETLRP